MTRRRLPGILALFVTAAMLVLVLRPAKPIEPSAALADFERLQRHLAEAWANMEWIASHRRVDLQAASRRVEEALAQARTVPAARSIIQEFVQSFHDPHFGARPVEPSLLSRVVGGGSAPGRPLDRTTSGRTACKAMGFRSRDLGFRLRFDRETGFHAAPARDDNPFEAGVLTLAGGTRLGLLRIAHFGEDGYPETCAMVWEAERARLEEPCTGCWNVRLAIRNRLLADIEQRVRDLVAVGYDMLVVDITGNGGGTDWVTGAVRIVSPGPLRCNRSSFVKHPHWQEILEAKQREVREQMEREGLPERSRATLRAAEASLESLLEQTRSPCDRMPMWKGEPTRDNCSNLVAGESYTCGLFDYLEPGALEGVDGVGILYKSLEYRFTESVNTKPLVVLVDHHTASASEDFASILQDNGTARIVGTRTYGAGCGFVNGGIPLILENVGLEVMAPDCVRYRKDGTNEIEGVVPDLIVNISDGDSAGTRTAGFLEALSGLPAMLDESSGPVYDEDVHTQTPAGINAHGHRPRARPVAHSTLRRSRWQPPASRSPKDSTR